MKHIGNEVERILKLRGILKKDFAEQIGITDHYLSKILKKNTVDAALLEKIAQNLHVSASSFFDDIASNNTATGTLNAAGNGNTISGNTINGNDINGHVYINIPPDGYQTVINSKGEINIIASASADDRQNLLIERDKLRAEVLELSRKVIELQNERLEQK